MPNRCPACHQLVDDNRLVACPTCHALLTTPPQVVTLGKEQEDHLVNVVIDSLSKSGPTLDKLVKPVGLRIVKSVHWWIAFPLFWLVVIVGSHFTIKGVLESLMISRIDQEFREPRVQATMQKVINDKSSEMLTNEIQPEVDRFRADLQKEYQTVAEEVARLRIQTNLPVLGDKAISEGDRSAFEEILRIAQTETKMNSLKKAAMEEIRRVIGRLSASSFTEDVPRITLDDGTVKRDWESPSTILITRLANSDSQVRVRAAVILGDRPEKGVPDNLLQVVRTDKHLHVVYQALLSFGYVTGRLKKPGFLGGINITPVIEMFDIEKLEQWWQQHSAEVNETLAPAVSQ